LFGNPTVLANHGVADFPNLAIDVPGTYTFTVTSGSPLSLTNSAATGIASVVSDPFAVTDQLVVSIQPPASVAPRQPFQVVVKAVDGRGNFDPNFAGIVTIALDGGPAGAKLGGTLTVAARAGVATFSNLTVDTAGSGYSLRVDDGAATVVTMPFDVVGATVTSTSPPPGTDLTLVVPVTPGTSKRQGSRFRQTFTLVNRSGKDLTGSLDLLLNGLSRKVKVQSAIGGTAVRPSRGSPYVVVTPPGGTFRRGQTLTVTLTLTVPARLRPRFTTRVLVG
jgi:hypothetical protein